jgi:hypothetical protein
MVWLLFSLFCIPVFSYLRGHNSDISSPTHLKENPCSVSQIHLAQGHTPYSMIVSWMTVGYCKTYALVSLDNTTFNTVYITDELPVAYNYMYYGEMYTSGYFHHIELTGLMPSQTYFYKCGDLTTMSPTLQFTTLPSIGDDSEPQVFGIIGDLGQTSDSEFTVQHINTNHLIQMVLHAGDLSYADCNQPLWDSYAEMVEPLAQRVPWMVCAGNHEIEYNGSDYSRLFLAFQTRYRMPEIKPYELGEVVIPSTISPYTGKPYCNPSIFQMEYNYGNSFYSFETGLTHVIYLNPYAISSPDSVQYKWLHSDLLEVDRTETPWIIVVMHCPWYSSNKNHYGDAQTVAMRDSMEDLFYQFRVNIVFSGHVHAYERTYPVYKNKTDIKGPVYITIGDGGNLEGHDNTYIADPEWSAFRNGTQYGYGTLTVSNKKMVWKWYRNTDKQMVFRDETILCNSYTRSAFCV